MKRLAIIITLLITALHSYAQELEDVLSELDNVIEHKQDYRSSQQKTIDKLKKRFNSAATDEQRSELAHQLYMHYSHYKADSALLFLEAEASYNNVKEDVKLIAQNHINKAEVYAIIGAYDTAEQHIKMACATAHTDNTILTRYYHVCRTLYGWKANYMKRVEQTTKELLSITQHYRDSIISVEKNPLSRAVVVADNYIQKGDSYQASITLNGLSLKESQEEQQLAYILYIKSEVARLQGNSKEQMKQLALTAQNDIRRGVTEYSALQELANLLFENGDIARSYSYLLCAMEDASTCNARLRSVEISNVYPIIEKAYEEYENDTRNRVRFLLIGLSVLALMLIGGLVFLRCEMRKLSVARSQLAQTNKQLNMLNEQLNSANQQLHTANEQLNSANLQLNDANMQLGEKNNQLNETNSQLLEMDHVKEEYFAIYLGKCRYYIDSLEDFRRRMLKLVKNNQQNELMKMLKDDSFMEKDNEQFYTDFDNAFLGIHPHFVDRFNDLLRPEERIIPKKGERLTTEMRIFALIRLGVKDTAEIAHFLNYSMPTIYNYRSRVKAKSIYEKDEFDKRLLEL